MQVSFFDFRVSGDRLGYKDQAIHHTAVSLDVIDSNLPVVSTGSTVSLDKNKDRMPCRQIISSLLDQGQPKKLFAE